MRLGFVFESQEARIIRRELQSFVVIGDGAVPIACSTTGDAGFEAVKLSGRTEGRAISLTARKMHAANRIAERAFTKNSALFFRRMRCGNSQSQATTSREGASNGHALGCAGTDKVIEDAIYNLFVERRRVSE